MSGSSSCNCPVLWVFYTASRRTTGVLITATAALTLRFLFAQPGTYGPPREMQQRLSVRRTTANTFISPLWAASMATVWINVMFVRYRTEVRFTVEERVGRIAPAVGRRRQRCAGTSQARAAAARAGPGFRDLLTEQKLSRVKVSVFYHLIHIAY